MRQKRPNILVYVGLYLVLGLLWIYGSDAVLVALLGQDTAAFALISSIKGSFFVVVTGLFFYIALRRIQRVKAVRGLKPVAHEKSLLVGMLLLALSAPFIADFFNHLFYGGEHLGDGMDLLLAGLVPLTIAAFLVFYYRHQLHARLGQELRQEAALREDMLGHFFNLPFFGMALSDPYTGQWLRVNEQLASMLGYSAADLCKRRWQDVTPADDLAGETQAFERLMKGEIRDYVFDKHFVSAAGERIPVRIFVQLIYDPSGKPEFIICMVQNQTREQEQQMLLQRESSLYNMLSQVNQLILHSKSEDEVLQSACEIAITLDELTFAWVGRCDDQRHLRSVVAHAGNGITDEGFKSLFALYEQHPGQGLSEKALLEERTVVDIDSMNAPEYKPWRDFIQRFDCCSAVALPIRKGGQIYANLTLYSNEVGFFTDRLVETLEEMASDIGFALDSIQRDRALEAANQVINSSPFVLIRWSNDPGWPVTFVSDNIRRWGLSPDRFLSTCGTFEEIIHPEDQGRIAQEIEEYLTSGVNEYSQLYRICLPDGRLIWVDDRTHVIRDENGEVAGIEGVLVDVTERQQQESRLQQAAAVVQSTREGVLVTDAEHQVLQINPAFTDMFGWQEDDLIGKTPAVLRSGRHSSAFYRKLGESLEQDGYWQGEILSRRRDGEAFPALLSISRVRNHYNETTHYVGVYTDLTRLKNSESRIEFLSNYDPLTELPNRQQLFRRLEECIEYNRRHDRLSALVMADLDNFKTINDSLGHIEGDNLLIEVVSRFKTRVREEDSLYRLGGDEFAILLEDVGSSERAARVADELMRQLTPVFVLGDGVEVRTSASCGISMIDGGVSAPEAILQQADAALFKAKEQRGSLSFFSDDLTASARYRLDLEQRLRYAIEHDELCLFYQPQWNVRTGELTGLEALIRWHDAERGLIAPGVFIPVAEQSSLIGAIGCWVVRHACQQMAEWLESGLDVPRVAVNVSPQQLHYHDLVSIVRDALQETGIPPARLEIELTEGVLMSSSIEPEVMLDSLRQLGVRLAIDDFGTGYSSLAYLTRFPLDLLKIDKSFTDDLLFSPEARAVVETIIVLGQKLNLTVLAEGVENSEQLDALSQLGCHQFQGYLRSRPLPIEEVQALLANLPH